jgi:UDP-glucuronate 4-epimerase
VTKLAGEHLCHLYGSRFGVPIVTLRYFTVYGPRQRPDMAFARFVEAAAEDREIEVFGDGSQTRDFTHVDDAVAATMAAASEGRPGTVYNVAGGSQVTVTDVLGKLEGLLGRRLRVRHVPPLPGDARHTSADISRARRDLSYVPGVGLENGLASQLAAQVPGAEGAAEGTAGPH